MWWVGAVAGWLVGAWALALLVGAMLRRGQAAPGAPAPDGSPAGPDRDQPPVRVPVQRTPPAPATPPYGLRSQAHLSCAAGRPRP